MAKVEINSTPPATAEQEPLAEGEWQVTDAKGRVIKFRQLDFIDESRIARVLGEAAMNQAYLMGYVMPAVMVYEIDGETFQTPSTFPQIEAAIKRLGRDGTTAVLKKMEAEAAPDDEAQLKK